MDLSFRSDRKLLWAAVVLVICAAIYLCVNIFVVGGDEFVARLNRILALAFVVFPTVLAGFLFSQLKDDRYAGRVWGALFGGLVCSTLAEVAWFIYTSVWRDFPYPSIADLFWLLGYLAVLYGLILRFRVLLTRPTKKQARVLYISAIIFIPTTVLFVMVPMLKSFHPERIFESILFFLYPSLDLILLFLAWQLLMVYEGRFRLPWQFSAAGLALLVTSELLYTYAAWYGIYYPAGRATLTSTLIDYTYNISYGVLATGIFLYVYLWRSLLREKISPMPVVATAPEPERTNVFVITDKNRRLYLASENLFQIIAREGRGLEARLGVLLGLNEEEESVLCGTGTGKKDAVFLSAEIFDAKGRPHRSVFLARPNYDDQGNYSGSKILIRVPRDFTGLQQDKNEETLLLAENFVQKTDIKRIEAQQRLLDKYASLVEKLASLALQYGGLHIKNRMHALVAEIAAQHGWNTYRRSSGVRIPEVYDLQGMVSCLPVLLHAVKQYVAGVASQEIVDTELRTAEAEFAQLLADTIKQYHLRQDLSRPHGEN